MILGVSVFAQFGSKAKTRWIYPPGLYGFRKVVKTTRIPGLAADAQLAENSAVTLGVALAQIGQQTATTTNQFQQAATRVVVMLVNIKMPNKLINSLGQKRNLHFWRPGIALMVRVLLNYAALLGFLQRHS